MEPLSVFLVALSFVVVLWVTWAVGEPILFGVVGEERETGPENRLPRNAADAEELQEDLASGKIDAEEFARVSGTRGAEITLERIGAPQAADRVESGRERRS